MRLAIYYKYFPVGTAAIRRGMAKAIDGLAGGLVRAGADLEIVTEGRADWSGEGRGGYALRCFRAVARGQSFRLPRDLIRHLLATRRPDLVLINGLFSPQNAMLARGLRRSDLAYVVAPHDPYNDAMFAKNRLAKQMFWRLFEQPMLAGAHAVQVLDARHGAFLSARGIHNPVIAVPNGVDAADAELVGAAHLTAPVTAPSTDRPARFFFLGRIDQANKGLDLLIDAFARFAAGRPVQLTLQGPDAGDAQALRARAAARGLDDRFTLLDPDHDTPSPLLVAGHDVFCLPSRYEGFGLAALEAMLAGRVLLVSDVGGIAGHVTSSGCGVVVTPSVEDILRGLDALWARRTEWPAMGMRGRTHALTQLSWAGIGRAALEAYRALAPEAALAA